MERRPAGRPAAQAPDDLLTPDVSLVPARRLLPARAAGIGTAPRADAPTEQPPAPRRNRLAAAAALTLAAVAAGAAAGYVSGRAGDDSAGSAPAAPAVATGMTPEAGGIDVAAVVASVEPSTVSISTHVVQQQGPFQVEGEGAGTGIVIDEEGHILTNAHVVEGATEVSVAVNGEERSATVVGGDSARDIAVVQLDDPTGIVPADARHDRRRGGRRPGGRDRQRARPRGRPDRDPGDRLGARPLDRHPLQQADQPDPDRCRDQLRQLRRARW